MIYRGLYEMVVGGCLTTQRVDEGVFLSRVNVCDWLLWFYYHRQTHCNTQNVSCQHEF